VDLGQLFRILVSVDFFWIVLAILMFVPQTIAIAWRWQYLVSPVARISFAEAGRQVVSSSCLNLILPSKMGDLAKGVFVYQKGDCGLQQGMQLVVFEKFMDLAALSSLMLVASLFAWPNHPILWAVLLLGAFVVLVVFLMYYTPFGSALLIRMIPGFIAKKKIGIKIKELFTQAPEIMSLLHADTKNKTTIIGSSLGIWVLHLIQVVCFFKALSIPVSTISVLIKMPMAIFSGLLPFTIAGFGIRDWTIIALFETDDVSRVALVAVGVLFSYRYIMPALVGAPYAGYYFSKAKRFKKEKESKSS